MKFEFKLTAYLAAALLCGCTNDMAYHPSAGQKVHITQETYNYFKEYQQTIGSTHPGAFAVSESGRNSAWYYCPEIACLSGPSYGQQAVKDCNRFGEPCYVFAHNNDIEYKYEIVP